MVHSLESAQRPYATLKFDATPKSPPALKKTSLFSIDALICCEPPGLVLRTQEIVSISGQKRRLMYCNPNAREKLGEPPLTMFICLHVRRNELASLINPIVKAYRAGENAPLSTYTCGRCDTDFCIEICEYETESALIITKWFNLGASLSPDDPHWKRHADFADRVHTDKVRPSPCDGKKQCPSLF